MAAFIGFSRSTGYDKIATGRWYVYESKRDGHVLFLAAEDQERLKAVRFQIHETEAKVTAVDYIDRVQIEAPAFDVTDRLVIRPAPSGLPFNAPRTHGRAEPGCLISDGSDVSIMVSTHGERVTLVDLRTGQAGSSTWEHVHPSWEIDTLTNGGSEELVASFVVQMKEDDQ